MSDKPIEFITKVEEFKLILEEFPQVEKEDTEVNDTQVEQTISLENVRNFEESKK